MESKVKTVGDLRELLRYSEDEEPLTLKLDEDKYLICGNCEDRVLWFKINKDYPKHDSMHVEDFRELIKSYKDDEPLTLILTSNTPLFGTLTECLKCVGASSTAGGRVTILWFEAV